MTKPRSDKGLPHVRSYKSLLPPNKKQPKVSGRQIELKLKKVKPDPRKCRKNNEGPHNLVCKVNNNYDLSCQKDWRILVCTHCGWQADSYTPVFTRIETKWKPAWVKDAVVKAAPSEVVITVEAEEQAVG